jgi:hypothetical protein
VDHREVSAIAYGMQRGGGLRQVIANDVRVADLAVTEAELEVGKTDGPRIMRALGRLQGACEKRDSTRRLASRRSKAAVHPPEIRKTSRIEPFSRFGRPPERFGCLSNVVLEEPRLGQRAPDLDLLLAPETRPLQRPDEEGRRIRTAPLIERLYRLAVEVGGRQGGDSIPRIQASGIGDPGFGIRTGDQVSSSSRIDT